MKKQPNRKYFKNCTVKFSQAVRNSEDGTFKYYSYVIKDCLVITTEGKKGIEFIYNEGVTLIRKKKRPKRLSFTGVEISEFNFELALRKIEVEVLDAKMDLEKMNKTNIKQIDLNDFPKTL